MVHVYTCRTCRVSSISYVNITYLFNCSRFLQVKCIVYITSQNVEEICIVFVITRSTEYNKQDISYFTNEYISGIKFLKYIQILFTENLLSHCVKYEIYNGIYVI